MTLRKAAMALLTLVALMLAACGSVPTSSPVDTGSNASVTPPAGDTDIDATPSEPSPSEASSDPAPASDTPAAAAQFDDLVPPGTEADIGPWQVTLLSINPDAWAELSDVDGIDPPAPGHQYVVARMQLTNTGDSARVDLILIDAYVGSDGERHLSGEHGYSCREIPEGRIATHMINSGETKEVNFCWSVPANVVQGGAINIRQPFGVGDGNAMFEGVR